MSLKHMLAYKIVEQYNREVKTLFHGVKGSRIILENKWLEAEEKLVSDGTSSTKYLSGWHVLLSKEDAEEYLKSFKVRLDKLKIVPVQVKQLRRKEHSNHPVYLAKFLKLLK